MISSLAQEIAKWIAEHQGVRPSRMYVPQAVLNECMEEARKLKLITDEKYKGDGTLILGIPVLVDPTLTIGKIDP